MVCEFNVKRHISAASAMPVKTMGAEMLIRSLNCGINVVSLTLVKVDGKIIGASQVLCDLNAKTWD